MSVIVAMIPTSPPPTPYTSVRHSLVLPPAPNGTSRPKAIFVPSGDQVGAESCAPVVGKVIWVWPDPSAFITQIALVPDRSLSKMIFPPSGDHAGLRSC